MEVPIDSVRSAVNAVVGGASRLELSSCLSLGGITPSTGLFETVKKLVGDVPVYVMIRCRPGDFCFDESEVETMRNEILAFNTAGAQGYKIGVLLPTGKPDYEQMKVLLSAAGGRPCTFHRAFDITVDAIDELENIAALGFARVLSSGLAPNCTQGIDTLVRIADRLPKQLILLPGGGVNTSNLVEILRRTKTIEFHASGSVIEDRSTAWNAPEGFDFGDGAPNKKVSQSDRIQALVKIGQEEGLEMHPTEHSQTLKDFAAKHSTQWTVF